MPTTTTTNTLAEISFQAMASYENPFMDVTLDVEFTDPTGEVKRVPAFWAGKGEWRVRYASPLTGSHSYRTICNPVDTGLHGIEGSVEITAYSGDNPLY